MLCMTRSAPSSNGRCRIGLANVLSQASSAPRSCASAASAAMSLTRSSGFDGVSIQSIEAGDSSARDTAATSVVSTNSALTPHFGSTSRSCFAVPW